MRAGQGSAPAGQSGLGGRGKEGEERGIGKVRKTQLR